ncbi:DNA-binding transcriptional regulator [Paramesorhizobium deserti]|uniref:DNA-binding transcriptional regulator n=1 Tax=Paramesorhizobium deserti TaxID=1494590 RepID=A0A135HTY7_9HYPH|nr:sugar-binding transcriptional regulator [Paramesorhizobium deserti]KXF76657.1 DNA-binding transcriptional regulator [Paramesorhizobium deserti]
MNDFTETPANASGETEQIRARVAWYYYVGGLTQQEIADKLRITRLRVNKIVVQARSEGLVSVDIKMPLTHCVVLEEKLKERFGLVDCSVVPSVPDLEDLHRVLGRATAAMLDPLLVDGQGFGIGWGQTLSAARRHLTPRRLPNAWVAALMGGLTRGSGTNTFEVSTEFARMLGAECYYVAAPIYCPSSESRTTLLTHYGLAETMERGRKTAVALIACGDLSNYSLLAKTQIVTENLPTLKAAGAVGDILGVFLDEDGKPVDHPLNQRVMAMQPSDLKLIPSSVLASGGMHKVPIIRAVLRAGYVNRLVTDEEVAEAILKD